MSVIEFYAKFAVEGRAPLRGRGRPPKQLPSDAPAWVVRISAYGRTTYWLCKRDEFEIHLLDPTSDVTTLKRENTPHSAEWHRAIVRSPRLEMQQIA